MTYYSSAWLILACVFTLALQDMKYLDTASGKSDGKFFTNGDIVSCILIGTNLMIVVQIVKSSDLKRRRIFADRIRKLFTEMTVAEERVWGDGRHTSLQTFHTCYGHGHDIQMRQCVVAAVLGKRARDAKTASG